MPGENAHALLQYQLLPSANEKPRENLLWQHKACPEFHKHHFVMGQSYKSA